MNRWPSVALVVLLLVAGMAYDRVERVEPEAPAPAPAVVVNPVMVQPARLSSVWYCPVGSSAGGYADQSVEVVNLGQEPAVATVSMLTDTGPGPSIRLDIGPGSERTVMLGDLERAEAAGAVVEMLEGQGVVSHVVATPHGPVGGVCATEASEQWHFAGGATTRDATFQLALLNPFSEDAVFDVRFEATGRSRAPGALQGAVVPARSVQVIDVTEHVAREAAVATTVTLRRGQLVAERLQSFDGVLGPVGSALQLGAPSATLEAWYPAGRIHQGGDQRLVLYNPTDTGAELDVSFVPFDAELTTAFGLVPLEVSVAPGRFEVIDLVATATQLGVPLPFDTGLHVVSVNGVAVVGERWSTAPPVDPTLIGAGGSSDDAVAGPEGAPPDEQPTPGDDTTGDDTTGAAEADAPAEQAAAPLAAGGGDAAVPVALGAGGVRQGLAASVQAPAPEPEPAPEPAAPPGSAAGGPPAAGGEAPQGGEDVEVPVEEPVVVEPPQVTPTAGVVIDRGVVTTATRWVLPSVPRYGGEGTVLVVMAAGSRAMVEVRSRSGGESSPPVAAFAVGEGRRVSVPLPPGEPASDLVVRASEPVVVGVSLVDGEGSLAARNGVPVLDRARS